MDIVILFMVLLVPSFNAFIFAFPKKKKNYLRGMYHLITGLIVFFTPVIYVISGFHPYKIFGLICTLVKNLFSGKHPL